MQALKTGVALSGALALAFGLAALPAHAQKRGGELSFVVGSKIPSYDGHMETTFGMIHPIRPFYSLLIRVNPDNPGDPTDIVCDLCEGDVPEPTDDEITTYYEKIKDHYQRRDVLTGELIWCRNRVEAAAAAQKLAQGVDVNEVRATYSFDDKQTKPIQFYSGSEGLFWEELWAAEPNGVAGPLLGFYSGGSGSGDPRDIADTSWLLRWKGRQDGKS